MDASYAILAFGPRETVHPDEFVSHRERSGERVRAEVGVSVDLTEWLRLNARWDLDLLESEFRVQRIERTDAGFTSALTLWQVFRQRLTLDLELYFDTP